MKDQYFGDINDFKKYGLLRIISNNGAFKTTICWMLTDSDRRTDGRKIGYLNDPENWRHYDPGLFDELRDLVKHNVRSVKWVEKRNIVCAANFYSIMLSDNPGLRQIYFRELFENANGNDFMFFDPDNGMEVKSIQKGKPGSSKYLYWDELIEAYRYGHSILVYQHFPRVSREQYISDIQEEIQRRVKPNYLVLFRTINVLFILIAQSNHKQHIDKSCIEINKRWNSTNKPLVKIYA